MQQISISSPTKSHRKGATIIWVLLQNGILHRKNPAIPRKNQNAVTWEILENIDLHRKCSSIEDENDYELQIPKSEQFR